MEQGNRKILLDSTHFNEIRSAIRSRSVAWDALARSSELSEIDASTAKKLENLLVRNSNGSDNALEKLAVDRNIIEPLIHLLSTSENNESIKSVQNLIAELLSCDKFNISNDTIKYFQENPNQLDKLFEISFRENDDLQTILISTFNLVSLLIQPKLTNNKVVELLLRETRVTSILQNTSQMDSCYVCVRLLQELSTIKCYRSIIWKNESTTLPTVFKIISRTLHTNNNNNNNNNNTVNKNSNNTITSHLPSSSSSSSSSGGHTHDDISNEAPVFVNTNSNNLGIQLQYYSLLLIWLLTFDNKIAYEIETKYLDNLLNLLKLVKITIKEKISRLSISILLQCCSKGIKDHKTFIKNLILLGNGIPTLTSLSERKYSDEELKNDINDLKELLEEEYRELTTFDEYLAELNSKLICWSPPHIDTSFWSDNIDKFKQDNWKLFKQLVDLLIEFKDSNDDKGKIIIQVVLNDITHVIELLPGESVDMLNKLNGKVVIMELLNHNDSRIKFEALKATQSIIGYTFK